MTSDHQNWSVLGFLKEKKFFTEAIASGSLAHAYVLRGQEMIGKRTFALEIAKRIIGSTDRNPDFLLVDVSNTDHPGSIGIEQIRTMQTFFVGQPYSSTHKIVLINDAHLMTEEAQNALLKLIEEPPRYALFLLVTHMDAQLLPTIHSRCQMIDCAPHSREILQTSLASNTTITDQQKIFLISFTNGRIGLINNIIATSEFPRIKEQLQELATLMKSDCHDRLLIAQKLASLTKPSSKVDEEAKADDENELKQQPQSPANTALSWLLYLHMNLGANPNYAPVARNVLDLYKTLQEPELNKRLLLETMMVRLP